MTDTELSELRAILGEIRTAIADLRAAHSELRADVATFRHDVRQGLSALFAELRAGREDH
jgi:hypothetical protein